MACYAALLSLFHTLNNIKNHPRPPISIHQQQLHSLTQNLIFLLDFLERYPNTDTQEDDDLESRIIAAAYAAEDVIETHIVDQIDHAGSTSGRGENMTSSVDSYGDLEREIQLYGDLGRVIQEMDSIKGGVLEIIQQKTMRAQDRDLHTNSSVSTSSVGPAASTWQSSIRPVFDDAMITQVLDKLTGQQSSLQIIPIVGMGGIGKTTFAKSIYTNPLIVEHFDILAWVTISQEYSVPEILRQVLCQGIKESEMSENELGEGVHKKLWCRRYLIVMDDLWSTEASDKLRCFFPDNNNGSRIMITTRLSNLAFDLCGSHFFRMNFLDGDKSWDLLCEVVFGKGLGCPIELENIGKEIARKCKGLPLSIVVVGGLLKKFNWTWAQWEYTLQNLNSLLNLEESEYCKQILRTSYKELPIYLKPCFLYMGVFPEDSKINVSKLITLWVAEGILRPTDGKILEEVAEKYVNELIDRNLIIVDGFRWNGKAKLCKMHDLLRDLCISEAQKQQRFIFFLTHQRSLNMERRICIHQNTKEEYSPEFIHALESAWRTRSLFLSLISPVSVQSHSFRLLRIYSEDMLYCGLASVDAIFRKVNLRYLNIVLSLPTLPRFTSSLFLLWNLQTLKVDIPYSMEYITAPFEIWEMSLLRHVIIEGIKLPNPLCGENNVILVHLCTLSRVCNFKCSEGVVKRIPNIKTMKLKYRIFYETEYLNFGLNNFGQLEELQSLNISIEYNLGMGKEVFQRYLGQNLALPHSLKKLNS